MFVLSKILLFLIFPITWVFLLLVWAVLTKQAKRRKVLLISTLVVLYLFSCPLLLNVYARLWRYPAGQMEQGKVYSCAILLGGFCAETSQGNGYFTAQSDRFIQALGLQINHRVAHVLITGRNGSLTKGFDEAAWAQNQFKRMQVPDSCILIEDTSKNTIQNAVYSQRLLAQRHLQPPYLLITSDFHMRRAMYIFNKKGIPVIPYPANYIAGIEAENYTSVLPSGDVLAVWQFYIKELLGMVTAIFTHY